MNQKLEKIKFWISHNKAFTLVLLVLAYFIYTNSVVGIFPSPYTTTSRAPRQSLNLSAPSKGLGSADYQDIATTDDYYGYEQTSPENRRVVTQSNLSLLVKSVRESLDAIQAKAEEFSGFMVNKNVITPGGEESGYITIRVPLSKREEMVAFLRTTGLRVINETISASDVTDQYTDIERRLEILNQTKTRFEEIALKATTIDEILRVQRELISLQNQIDALVGQQRKLNTTTLTTLITVNVSTDELALPYTPDEPWRPNIIFKLAVRSMLGSLQNLGTNLIWLAVYAVIWVPALAIAVFIYKKWLR